MAKQVSLCATRRDQVTGGREYLGTKWTLFGMQAFFEPVAAEIPVPEENNSGALAPALHTSLAPSHSTCRMAVQDLSAAPAVFN